LLDEEHCRSTFIIRPSLRHEHGWHLLLAFELLHHRDVKKTGLNLIEHPLVAERRLALTLLHEPRFSAGDHVESRRAVDELLGSVPSLWTAGRGGFGARPSRRPSWSPPPLSHSCRHVSEPTPSSVTDCRFHPGPSTGHALVVERADAAVQQVAGRLLAWRCAVDDDEDLSVAADRTPRCAGLPLHPTVFWLTRTAQTGR